MRVFYPVWQVTELAAGYRYTTDFIDLNILNVVSVIAKLPFTAVEGNYRHYHDT